MFSELNPPVRNHTCAHDHSHQPTAPLLAPLSTILPLSKVSDGSSLESTAAEDVACWCDQCKKMHSVLVLHRILGQLVCYYANS